MQLHIWCMCASTDGHAWCNTQVANLLLAAKPTHVWYLEHFSIYPKHRRALIPYIY